MSATSAIASADKLLPGRAAPDGKVDPRWQAIIEVAEYIPEHPEEVWGFAARWGSSKDPDLRAAISTCVLEHLLEHHFDYVFPKLEALAKSDPLFGEAVRLCWPFGEAERTENVTRLANLKSELDV